MRGRCVVVHELGFGAYSAVQLAVDYHLQRYISLEILVANKYKRALKKNVLRLLRITDLLQTRRVLAPAIDFALTRPVQVGNNLPDTSLGGCGVWTPD